MRSLQILFAFLSAGSLSAEILPDGKAELVAIQQGGAETYCTGLMVGRDTILSHAGCLLDDNEVPRQGFSALPGLNGASSRGPLFSKPHPREFVVSSVRRKRAGPVLLQLGQIEGRNLPNEIIAINLDADHGSKGDPFTVFYYTGDVRGAQHVETCALVASGPLRGMLDCNLPQSALGAPVVHDDLVVGVISDPEVSGGSFFSFVTTEVLPSIKDDLNDIIEVDVVPFGSVDILNLCDVDIHQGLFYLDGFGEKWLNLAKRVPAMSRTFLPVETVGDAVFSYGRSDDGSSVWAGDDIKVMIKGSELSMREIDMPKPTGDLTIVYECE
jgi:hypothetical protein